MYKYYICTVHVYVYNIYIHIYYCIYIVYISLHMHICVLHVQAHVNFGSFPANVPRTFQVQVTSKPICQNSHWDVNIHPINNLMIWH